MSSAFAPIVRARPNPIFGRPVHQGSPPIDYSPILLLKPFGFRIAPDTLSSDENLVGQRGITPRLWIQRPSSERRRDFNPPDSCAAQRTLRASPPPQRARPVAARLQAWRTSGMFNGQGAHSRGGGPTPALPRAQSADRRESPARQSHQGPIILSGHLRVRAAAPRSARAAGRTPDRRWPSPAPASQSTS